MSLGVGVVGTNYPDSYFKEVQWNPLNKEAKNSIRV